MVLGMIIASHMPEWNMRTMEQSTSTTARGTPKHMKKNREPRKMRSSINAPYILSLRTLEIFSSLVILGLNSEAFVRIIRTRSRR
jgi:hypothetical protein